MKIDFDIFEFTTDYNGFCGNYQERHEGRLPGADERKAWINRYFSDAIAKSLSETVLNIIINNQLITKDLK